MKSNLRILTGIISALTACLFLNAPAQSTNTPQTLSELQSKLLAHISQKKFEAGLFGVKVVSLDTGKLLFEHNPHKLFSPASNSKLYTCALGLDRLGPDYRIKTSLYSA